MNCKKKWHLKAFGVVTSLVFLINPALAQSENTISTFHNADYQNSLTSLDALTHKIDSRLETLSLIEKISPLKSGYSAGDALNGNTNVAIGPIFFASHLKQKNVGAFTGYKGNIEGLGIIGDQELKDCSPFEVESLRLGAAATYAAGKININMPQSNLKVQNLQIVGFGNLIKNDAFINLFLSGSQNGNRGRRGISNGLVATSRYKSLQFYSRIRAGYTFNRNSWAFIPEVSLDYLTLHQDSYTEKNAGNANLLVRAKNVQNSRAGIGGRVQYMNVDLVPEVHAFYFRDLKAANTSPVVRFISGGSVASNPSFNQKNGLNLGFSLTKILLPYNMFIMFMYDFQAKNKGYQEHTGSISMRWLF